jgi:hypothetical protein
LTLTTKSRNEFTLKEVAGVQLSAPSSQNEIVASVGAGGGPPPFAEVAPWHADNPIASAAAAHVSSAVRHSFRGCHFPAIHIVRFS